MTPRRDEIETILALEETKINTMNDSQLNALSALLGQKPPQGTSDKRAFVTRARSTYLARYQSIVDEIMATQRHAENLMAMKAFLKETTEQNLRNRALAKRHISNESDRSLPINLISTPSPTSSPSFIVSLPTNTTSPTPTAPLSQQPSSSTPRTGTSPGTGIFPKGKRPRSGAGEKQIEIEEAEQVTRDEDEGDEKEQEDDENGFLSSQQSNSEDRPMIEDFIDRAESQKDDDEVEDEEQRGDEREDDLPTFETPEGTRQELSPNAKTEWDVALNDQPLKKSARRSITKMFQAPPTSKLPMGMGLDPQMIKSKQWRKLYFTVIPALEKLNVDVLWAVTYLIEQIDRGITTQALDRGLKQVLKLIRDNLASSARYRRASIASMLGLKELAEEPIDPNNVLFSQDRIEAALSKRSLMHSVTKRDKYFKKSDESKRGWHKVSSSPASTNVTTNTSTTYAYSYNPNSNRGKKPIRQQTNRKSYRGGKQNHHTGRPWGGTKNSQASSNNNNNQSSSHNDKTNSNDGPIVKGVKGWGKPSDARRH